MKKLICKVLIATMLINLVPYYQINVSASFQTVYENLEDTEVLVPDDFYDNVFTNEIKTISVNIGETKSQLNFSWLSNSENESYVCIDGTNFVAQKNDEIASNEGFYKYNAVAYDINFDTFLYKVGNDELWSDDFEINISKDDNNFSFLLAGDPQIGSSGVVSDGKGWETTLNKAENWFSDIDFLLTTGDQVEASRTGYAEDEYEAFFAPTFMQTTPLAVNVGNHDVYTYSSYSDHFTLPNMDNNTVTTTTSTLSGSQTGDYWFEYEGTLFMSLNTNNLSNLSHIEFMKNAISEYTEIYGKPQWQIVTFHQSIYSSATHSSNATLLNSRIELADTFSELNIDAVLMGHDHVYTRCVMMQGLIPTTSTDNNINHEILTSVTDPKAGEVLYLTVNSSSGSKHYNILDVQYDYIAYKNQENTANITKVDVSDNALVFTTYRTGENNIKTDIVDTFSIIRTSNYTSDEKITENIVSNDVSAPVLNYQSEVTVYTDEDFDIFSIVSATDTTFDENGNYIIQDISDKIIVVGDVDTKFAGTYEVTFYVSDEALNTSKADVTFNVKECISYATTGSEWSVYSGDTINNWNTDIDISKNWNTAISPFTNFENDISYLVTSFDIDDISNVSYILGTVDNYKNTTLYINGNEISYTTSRGQSTNNFEITDIEKFLVDGMNILAVLHNNKDDIEFDLLSFKVILNKTPEKNESTSSNSSSSSNNESFNENIQTPSLLVENITDVSTSDWYYEAVSFSLENGLFVATNQFYPQNTMSRAMLWTVLYRYDGQTGITTGENWYQDAQEWSISLGISDGSNPNADITREQLVTILYRFDGFNAEINSSINDFTDGQNASLWAIDALNWAINEDLLQGDTNGLLNPNATATRAEVSMILMRYIKKQS